MTERRPPPAWIFALSGLPYGVAGAFTGNVMPYLTRRAGIEVDQIGWYSALLFVPTFFQFLYAPIIDIGPKRKHWLVIVALLGAALLVGACVMPLPQHTTAFLAFAFGAQAISGLVGACNGGLMAALMPDSKRGRAGAAYNIGNLSGGALSAAVAIFLTAQEMDPLIVGLAIGGMMVLPSLAILFVDEPPREHDHSLGETFAKTWAEVRKILTSRSGVTGIALCLSPVGTAALTNYFSAFGPDYHASDNLVAFTSGPANAGLTALGALIGGLLCDRYNRRLMYLLSGLLTAACAVAMMLSPRTDVTFAWGVMTYLLITGFCYAAFTATVLETIGSDSHGAATKYSMFTAAGNVAITYVGLVDTRFHAEHGVEGVIASDALLNVAGVVVLALVFAWLGLFKKQPPPSPADSASR